MSIYIYIYIYYTILHSCLGMVIAMQLEAGYITLNTRGAHR